MEVIVDVLGGKWKPGILFNLATRPFRFGELRRQLGPITEKMQTQQLRDLEREGVIIRIDYRQKPQRVEYALTDYGRSLAPILTLKGQWGELHAQRRAAAGVEVLWTKARSAASITPSAMNASLGGTFNEPTRRPSHG